MKVSNFDFHLPQELIAQYPLEERTASRLLHLNKITGDITHRQFTDLSKLLKPNDLLIFNNTKVIPARLFGQKVTGGKIEILLERILDPKKIIAQVKASKSPKIGAEIIVHQYSFTVTGRHEDFFELTLTTAATITEILEKFGQIPLPPYIKHLPDAHDNKRYQTVYATKEGAVAAPTAGLHFDEALITTLRNKKINTGFLTLHVGAGTFQPVRVNNIYAHKMHAEFFAISPELCELIQQAKKNHGRIIAVGTTTVRALESAAIAGEITPGNGDTDIFIYPGFQFKVIDGLITNFHLPKSTLLMLVCAFAGYDNIMHAYQTAIAAKYRFFSYGDAMVVI